MGNHTPATRAPSQRQLRVGEELRAALALIFMHGETHILDLDSASITVSEVRISPDLKNATAYVMPLGGNNKEKVLKLLSEYAPQIRHLLGKKILLRHTPKIFFKLDESFEVASRVHGILNSEKVRKDVEPE